jgi:pimeloyl-ACP methyl ester carboxylesterase
VVVFMSVDLVSQKTADAMVSAVGFDLPLRRGRLRAHRFGDPGGSLLLCLPGLSLTSRTFDCLGEGLADHGLDVVALDLRGRGYSEVTPTGTYGSVRHADDVLEAATALGARRFDLIGHSMGAYVALQAARLEPGRVRRLVLIDTLGIPRYAAVRAILKGLERLDRTYATPEEYIAVVRDVGLVVPWSEYWERAFRYDLVVVGGRVRARTSAAAVLEDVIDDVSHDPRSLWHGLGMPILVLRAKVPLAGPGGFILTEFDAEAFLRMTPSASLREVEANHVGIVAHPATLNAIRAFFH